MPHRLILSAVAAAATLAVLSASPATANPNHRRRHAVMRSAPGPAEAPGRPFMFYPQDIEGGVPGNLPFNNQIRKHTDPLNANGGR